MLAKRILVVEDEQAIRLVVEAVLIDEGYTVDTVPNGRVAIELLDADPSYDIVITDLFMPEIDGFYLIQWIHVYSGQPDVPIIVMTGCIDCPGKHLPPPGSYERLLPKPFSLETLVQAIEELSHTPTMASHC